MLKYASLSTAIHMVYVTFTARSRSALAMWHTSTMRSACLKRDILEPTPYDIETYNLPAHRMTEADIKRIDDALKNDPFIQYHLKLAAGIRAQ